MLTGISRVSLGMALLALLFTSGCRSATKDRIRVLEAEKAQWGREKSDLQHENASLRGNLISMESRADSAEARAATAQDRLALAAGPGTNEPAPPEVVLDVDAIERGLVGVVGVRVDGDANRATIILASDVSFRAGRTDLSSKAEDALRKVAGVLKSTPGVQRVRIEGHTDSDPIVKSGWDSNEALSLARASKVEKFLLHQGIPSDLVSVEGLGAARPIESNETKAGKAANRRVEIIVVGP